MKKYRFDRLTPYFNNENLDALWISDLMTIRYLTGFTGSSAQFLLPNPEKYPNKKPSFLTDGRYTLQAKEQTQGFDIVTSNTLINEIITISQRENYSRLGFETHHVTFDIYSKISKALGENTLFPLDQRLDLIRSIKDREEIDEIKKSISVATQSFYDIRPLIKEGITEMELKTELEYRLGRNGGSKISFDPIIAFGEHTACVHAVPRQVPLQKESLIMVDYGVYSGLYASDETITLYYGKHPSAEIRKMDELVRNAHDKAIEKIKPGMPSKEIDAIARKVIEDGGYGTYFPHSLGHSVGLEVHDGIRLSALSDIILEEGMVLTIEPGIYIEGIGGIRHEDMIHITASGCDVLTSLPKSINQNLIIP